MSFFNRICHTTKRLVFSNSGQGFVEYSFIVLLVAMFFWLGVRDTTIGNALANAWSATVDCVAAPFSCGSTL